MKKPRIQVFGGFRMFVDEQELPLSGSTSEFLSLLTIAGGGKITAKNDWEITKKDFGIKYNAMIYTSHVDELEEELQFFEITDILQMGLKPVRFCRLNTVAVECDYYQMLNGQIPFKRSEEFLPEYEWAHNRFYTTWEELRKAWK